MIISSVVAAGRYSDIHPLFDEAVQFLRLIDTSRMEPGRIEIDGDSMYAVLMRQQGKSSEEARLEAHRRFVDIQYLVDGYERIGWRALPECSSQIDGYDVVKDIVFFNDAPAAWLSLMPGCFAVFMPEDAHAPMVSDGIVTKVVVKIAV